MKPIKIIIYLLAIAAFEGALHQYLWVTASYTKGGMYHARYPNNRIPDELKKESAPTWWKVVFNIIHGAWALLIGIVRKIWHNIHEAMECILFAFELTEFFKAICVRFNFGGKF